MESLFDRLKSLGVQVGAKQVPAHSPEAASRKVTIQEVVSGEDVHTPFGPVFVSRKVYGPETLQGSVPLCEFRDVEILAEWNRTPEIAEHHPYSYLFLDAETSGLSGGAGTFAFLVGIGFLSPQGFELHQVFLRDPGMEAAFLAYIEQLAGRFKVIVSFNGKAFDIPLLNTRFTLYGFQNVFSEHAHVDLLQLARRLWRDRLPSRRLGNLETEILGLERTAEEVPGWMVPELYIDYLDHQDAGPLQGVFYHNEMDIVSMAALFHLCADILSQSNPNRSLHGLDRAALARLYEDLGRIPQALALYESALQQGDLPPINFAQTLHRYARIFKRRGDWHTAADLWKRAADLGDAEACIELAKYCEHQLSSPAEAFTWAQRALQAGIPPHWTPAQCRDFDSEIHKRLSRLNRLLTP